MTNVAIKTEICKTWTQDQSAVQKGCRQGEESGGDKHNSSTPAATISDLDWAYLGSTRPGQSHRVRLSVMLSVWKCLVLPGVGATAVFFEPKRALMVEDLPTLG